MKDTTHNKRLQKTTQRKMHTKHTPEINHTQNTHHTPHTPINPTHTKHHHPHHTHRPNHNKLQTYPVRPPEGRSRRTVTTTRSSSAVLRRLRERHSYLYEMKSDTGCAGEGKICQKPRGAPGKKQGKGLGKQIGPLFSRAWVHQFSAGEVFPGDSYPHEQTRKGGFFFWSLFFFVEIAMHFRFVCLVLDSSRWRRKGEPRILSATSPVLASITCMGMENNAMAM